MRRGFRNAGPAARGRSLLPNHKPAKGEGAPRSRNRFGIVDIIDGAGIIGDCIHDRPRFHSDEILVHNPVVDWGISSPDRWGSSLSTAETICPTVGLTRARFPTNTVGTVSSPPVAARTLAALPGTDQISMSVVAIPRLRNELRSLMQNGHPGLHMTSIPSTNVDELIRTPVVGACPPKPAGRAYPFQYLLHH